MGLGGADAGALVGHRYFSDARFEPVDMAQAGVCFSIVAVISFSLLLGMISEVSICARKYTHTDYR